GAERLSGEHSGVRARSAQIPAVGFHLRTRCPPRSGIVPALIIYTRDSYTPFPRLLQKLEDESWDERSESEAVRGRSKSRISLCLNLRKGWFHPIVSRILKKTRFGPGLLGAPTVPHSVLSRRVRIRQKRDGARPVSTMFSLTQIYRNQPPKPPPRL